MSKLLWHSNAPWTSTGYGAQTALFAPKLKEHYDLAVSAFYGLEGNVIPWNGIPVMPGMGQTHGNETILDHAQVHFGSRRDGLVVTLMDVWVLDPTVWAKLNVASWVPIDHDPAPPPIISYFAQSGAVPVAMSRFGEGLLADAGLEPLYCPHGVDTSILKPVERAKAREASGLPEGAFVVGMVAANKGNPSRKCFSEAFQAFKRLQAEHSDAVLYLHTEATGRFGGVNLPELAQAIGVPQNAIYYCDQYRAVHYPFSLERMAQFYSAMDVLLMPSAGEGFGIPAVEAQACGVPVIVSDFSAQPELCGAGWLVSGHRVFTPLGSWQFHPDVGDIHDALRQAYASAGRFTDKARKHAEQYDAGRVFAEHMLPAFKQARSRFEAREEVAA